VGSLIVHSARIARGRQGKVAGPKTDPGDADGRIGSTASVSGNVR